MSGIALTLSISNIYAQSYEWISSTEGNTWQQAKIKLQTKAAQAPVLDIDGSEDGTTFKAWEHASMSWDGTRLTCSQEHNRKQFSGNSFLPKET